MCVLLIIPYTKWRLESLFKPWGEQDGCGWEADGSLAFQRVLITQPLAFNVTDKRDSILTEGLVSFHGGWERKEV